MRKTGFALLILPALLLAGCGAEQPEAAGFRNAYMEMDGCTMDAAVSCDADGSPWRAELRCAYIPDGTSEIEVLSPETIAGVRAVLDSGNWYLQFDGKALDAGTVSRERISPAACLPRLMDALRNGWLLEENQEEWNGIPCARLALDQTGTQTEKIYSTLWLRRDNGAPLRGEISVDGETVLTAEFTSFAFYDTIGETPPDAAGKENGIGRNGNPAADMGGN